MNTEEYKQKYRNTILAFLEYAREHPECTLPLRMSITTIEEHPAFKAPEIFVDIWRQTARALNMYNASHVIQIECARICDELTVDYQNLVVG